MSFEITFEELMRRIRAGEPDAVALLERRYGDAVRRTARVRIRSAHLRRALDSADVWQSVLFSFTRRAARGEWQDALESSDELLKLLATMARYKVIDQERKAHAARRGGNNVQPLGEEDVSIPAPEASPSEQVADQELLALAREQLGAEETQLLELCHGERLGWAEIAARLGGTPEALRKRLKRALDRLRDQFGDKEEGDGTS